MAREPRQPRERRASAYVELLRDPRWQKRRLEILQRDGWECLSCGTKEKTLHVHHRKYERGKAPWEYPDEVLETLCEDCHEAAGVLRKRILDALADANGSSDEIQALGYLHALHLYCDDNGTLKLEDYHHAAGVAAAWEVGVYMTDDDCSQYRHNPTTFLLAFTEADGYVVTNGTRIAIVARYVAWFNERAAK